MAVGHGDKAPRWVAHYSLDHQILLVGDGDFSFSLCLAETFGSASNIVATSLDSKDELIKKYKNAESNVERLRNLEAQVLHGVDATQMRGYPELRMRKFDRIIFNFPHAGFHGKEDSPLMIREHSRLMQGFFRNASGMLRPDGEVHVTHKTSKPYCCWNIEKLALHNSLALRECVAFAKHEYRDYQNKRGDGSRADEPFKLGEHRTFKFTVTRHAEFAQMAMNCQGDGLLPGRCHKCEPTGYPIDVTYGGARTSSTISVNYVADLDNQFPIVNSLGGNHFNHFSPAQAPAGIWDGSIVREEAAVRPYFGGTMVGGSLDQRPLLSEAAQKSRSRVLIYLYGQEKQLAM